MVSDRRPPLPAWTIDDNGSCFLVKDDDGHTLALRVLQKWAWTPVCWRIAG
jgi:hypothetical protein